jgi:nucleotide-binding universal stress UspA family protein
MLIKKILIGIDDSKHAEHAAEYGFDIARKFNAAVGLVNIIEPVIIPQSSGGIDPIMGMPMQGTGMEEMEILDIQKNQSEDIIAAMIKKFAGDMEVTRFNEFGSSGDGILNCSKEFNADLIVLGTHSRTGLDRLLSGSVAEHVVRHSDVPVLVVPMKSEQ